MSGKYGGNEVIAVITVRITARNVRDRLNSQVGHLRSCLLFLGTGLHYVLWIMEQFFFCVTP